MDQPYFERFNIDKFIAICVKLSWLDMYVRCQNTAMLTEATKVPLQLKYIDDLRLSFAGFANQLCFILTKNNKAQIPTGMSDENFLKVRPIIERLVSEHELKEDWLILYKASYLDQHDKL